MTDLIIVGAGPAGLTAAIYARRAAKSVLVLEQAAYGGQIINTPSVENYPAEPQISGIDLATKMYQQATALGAEVRFEQVTAVREAGAFKEVVTPKGTYPCKAVILATGCENRKLGVADEEKLIGRGVSYCATCDGAFYRGKTVAVVGGGNTALEDALYLADLAETVYLIHRRDAFRGDAATVAQLKARENVTILYHSTVTRLCAERRLTGIEVTDTAGRVTELAVSGLFVAVGRVPNTEGFAPLVDLSEDGYAAAGENCRTKTAGIFAAGDNRAKEVRQLVTATADGAVAATEAVRYLNSL